MEEAQNAPRSLRILPSSSFPEAEGWGREGRRCGGVVLRSGPAGQRPKSSQPTHPKGSQHAHPTKMLPGCHGAVNVLLPSPGEPGKRQKKLGRGRKKGWEELPASHTWHRGGLLSVLRNTEPPRQLVVTTGGALPTPESSGFLPNPKAVIGGEGKFSELCAARAMRGGRERSSTELAPEGDNTALPSPPKKTPEALGWPQIWGLTAPPPPPRLPADEQRVLTPGSDEAASRAAAGHAGLRIPSKFHPNSFVRTRTGGEFRLTGTAGARGLAGLLPTPTGSVPNSQRRIEAVTL